MSHRPSKLNNEKSIAAGFQKPSNSTQKQAMQQQSSSESQIITFQECFDPLAQQNNAQAAT
jgi:hypothetical protein